MTVTIDPWGPRLLPAERLVLLFLEREPDAGVDRIAWMTGQSRGTVVTALRRIRTMQGAVVRA